MAQEPLSHPYGHPIEGMVAPDQDIHESRLQMAEYARTFDKDTYGILTTRPEDFGIEATVEAACEILIALEEDKRTMSSQERENLEQNRSVLVTKMRSLPTKAQELVEALEPCKNGPYVECCRKLPRLIAKLQAELKAP
ncbi:hypothetical protein WJX74_004300 [Apatococcus lobatus]|uniref:Uncharacterized protein n=1 Tax=Apatococcus lobatus TaxID=904363 RepID=A0AAW1SE91_9CHLO